MFVAWRELAFAKGRFVLIASVVALITFLVGALTGLTAGLAVQNITGITDLDADRIVFSDPPGESELTYDDSSVTQEQADVWSTQPGVSAVSPLGISQGRLSVGELQETVTLFGGDPGISTHVPSVDGQVALSRTTAAGLGVSEGDIVDVSGHDAVVSEVFDDVWYSHVPVVYVALSDWQTLTTAARGTAQFATVLVVRASGADYDAADAAAGTESTGKLSSLLALSSFRSEIGSLALIIAMLFGISGLVVGAFFTVWNIQRQPDAAVLKALGASTRMVVRDSLGQALVVLLLGVAVGLGLTVVLGLVVQGTSMPFVLDPVIVIAPAVLMILLGLAGTAFSLRSVVRADPLTALGSNR